MTDTFCGIAKIPERRRALRTPYRTPVHYANASQTGAGTVTDISSEGMFMETAGEFKVGERIKIVFQFRNSKHPMDIEGEITRTDTLGVGLVFLWS